MKLDKSIANRPYASKWPHENQHTIECHAIDGKVMLEANFSGGDRLRRQSIRFTLDPVDFAVLAAAMVKADNAKARKAFEKALPSPEVDQGARQKP